MRILINFATYGRLNAFVSGMENIEDTISKDADYEVIVSADFGDEQMDIPEIKSIVKRFKNTSIYFGQHVSKVAAINRFIGRAKKKFDILLNMSDDFRFILKDWDKQLVSDAKLYFNDSTNFLLHYPDGYVNERLPTMQIIGRQFYERTNEVYCSLYNSVSCDADAYYTSLILGKYKYIDKHLFVHNHPANVGGMVTDKTYLGNDFFDKIDTKTYMDRMKRYFDIPEQDRVMIPEQFANEIKNMK